MKSGRVFDTTVGQFYEEIHPPEKLKNHYYCCNNQFYLDILFKMIENKQSFGIILLSGDETRMYTVNGENFQLLYTIYYDSPNKHSRGGWSQQRFDRIRLEKINEYYKKITEKMKFYYIDDSTQLPKIKGLILAGPAHTKNKIHEHESFDYRLKKIITNIDTTAEIKDTTICEIIKKNFNRLESECAEVNELIEEFLQSVRLNNGLAVYGLDYVINCLKMNLLKSVIASQSFFDKSGKDLENLCLISGCQLVITQSSIINDYGGIVALSWYLIDHDYLEINFI